MKKLLKKMFLSLLLLTSLLTSCSSSNNGVFVTNDLDLYVEKDNTDIILKPVNIVGDTFFKKIDHKEDFVLYFYSNYCATCKLVDEYFNTFLRNYNFLIYSFSAEASDIHYISALYPEYFDVTPKIMFFKDGELSLTLSSSRYSSYRLFESAMIEFAKKSNIYTATKFNALQQFVTHNNEYYLILKEDDTSIVNNDGISAYDIYINDIRPRIEENSIPSLVLQLDKLDEQSINFIYTTFNLNRSVTTSFSYIYYKNIDTYNYLIPEEYDLMMGMLVI